MYAANVYAFLQPPPLVTAVRYIRQKVSFTLAGYANNQYPIYLCDPSGSLQVAIKTSEIAGTVYVMRGGTTVATWTGFGLVPGVAANIEAYTYIDSTAGFVKLYLNGILFNTFTGNTQNSSTYNTVGICGCYSSGTSTGYVHDIIIDDAPTDTIIGNQYVMTQRPAATVSKSSDITTSDSSDPYAVLAYTSPGGTPYVQFPTAGDALEVSFTALPVNIASISSVSVTADWSKATNSSYGAGDVTSRLDFTVGSDTVTGTAQALANGFVGHTENLTKVMTLANVNAMTATITRTV